MPFAAAAREKFTSRVSSAQVNDGNLRTGTVGVRRCTHVVQFPRDSDEQELVLSPAPHCGIKLVGVTQLKAGTLYLALSTQLVELS